MISSRQYQVKLARAAEDTTEAAGMLQLEVNPRKIEHNMCLGTLKKHKQVQLWLPPARQLGAWKTGESY